MTTRNLSREWVFRIIAALLCAGLLAAASGCDDDDDKDSTTASASSGDLMGGGSSPGSGDTADGGEGAGSDADAVGDAADADGTAEIDPVFLNVALAAPRLISPADGSTARFPQWVTLRWDSVPGATAYELDIDVRGEGNPPFDDLDPVYIQSATAYTHPFDDIAETRWRIRAYNSEKRGPWSETRTIFDAD